VEKGKPGPVEGRHRQFKLATNNSISHHEHVLYRFKLGYELINRALDFGRNGARMFNLGLPFVDEELGPRSTTDG
jgi:hypothetical protein